VTERQFLNAFINASIVINLFLALFGSLVLIAYLAKLGGTLTPYIELTALVSLVVGMAVGSLIRIEESRLRRGESE